jgi:uncharacterized protein
MSSPVFAILTPVEARVVAVLVEKQATVPDTYPLSLNALTAGCNQKTAREPVMTVSESEVLLALEALKRRHLVIEVSGSRVVRYEHNLGRVLAEPGASVALLAMLMLRGPQTAAELRLHSERLHRFADVSSVEGFLEELAGRPEPRVVKLARQPGARESRWAHLLGGPVSATEPVLNETRAAAHELEGQLIDELTRLRADHERLKGEVQTLRRIVERLSQELGVSLE